MGRGDCTSGKKAGGESDGALAGSAAAPLPLRDQRGGGGWQGESEPEAERRWLLLSRIDPERFRYFYEKHYPEILIYLHRLCRDRRRAEDLAAETFYQAQDRLCQFHWRGLPFKAWLYRIAGNAYRKQERRRRRWRRDDRDDALAECAAQGPTPEAEAIENEQERLLHSCLQRLDAKDRQLIVLHYWQELSLQEIAQVLGCNLNTIKSRLCRARERLRRLLESAELRGEPEGGRRPLRLVRRIGNARARSDTEGGRG